MSIPKVILTPVGEAIVLDKIVSVSITYECIIYDDLVGYYFKIINLNKHEYDFIYPFDKYSDSPEELKIKIQNIRLEIIRMLNDGIEAKEILGSINLKK